MIPRPPENVTDTKIFQKLESLASDPDGLNAKALSFITIAKPILDLINAGPFKNYTLHNRDHAKKLIHIAEHIIDEETISQYTPFECLLTIYSSYLHDMGLMVTDSEIERIVDTEDFKDSIISWPTLDRAIEHRRRQLANNASHDNTSIELELAELHGIAVANFLRPQHATNEKYKTLIKMIKDLPSGAELFEIRGVSFEEELINICMSHNLDASVLSEMLSAHEERFSRDLIISDHCANTQFLAAVLRITDILDFDFERTPTVLIECLGLENKKLPGSEVTIKEWHKHLSVQQLVLNDKELIVRSKCKHPAIESSVRQFCEVIESEIRKTLAVLRGNREEVTAKYQLKIPSNVRPEIKSQGYVYMDLSIRLDEPAITTLLMGSSLYKTRLAAIRELLQNSIDACSVRSKLFPLAAYTPFVRITHKTDDEGRVWIEVQDNGIGMDQDVLKNHFFRIGSSYYNSSDFSKILSRVNISSIPVIAKFGIGFLSIFMLADTVEVETKSVGICDNDTIGRRVRIDRLGAIAYVQEDDNINDGTHIRIRLLPELSEQRDVLGEISQYIKQTVLRPPVQIEVMLDGDSYCVPTSKSYALVDSPEARTLLKKNNLQIIPILIEEYSDIFKGKIFLFFVEQESGLLGMRHNDKLIEITRGNTQKQRVRVHPDKFFEEFDGNRISVGGFRMSWPRISRLLRRSSTFISAVFDIDIRPNKNLEFDVARTKIQDQQWILKNELLDALGRALVKTKVFEKLEPGIEKYFQIRIRTDRFLMSPDRYIDDEELLERVLNELPEDCWPFKVHRMIAEKIGISGSKCWDAISTLIAHGRVDNPNISKKN